MSGAAKVWDLDNNQWVYVARGYPGPSGPQGIQGIPGLYTIPPFSVGGALTVSTYTMRLYVDGTSTIQLIRASVGTAPVGSSIIVDVLKNGTTLFTGGTDRPTIAAGTYTDTGVPAVTSLVAGDYLTVSVVQIGSSTPGSDLTVQVVLV